MAEITKQLRFAVVGAGAVGSYFGGMLARAGFSVVLIGRAQHVEAIRGNGLYIDSEQFRGYIKIDASTDIEASRDANVVLFCTKSMDTISTAESLRSLLKPDSLILSLQNGVENPGRIQKILGLPAIPVLVYIAASISAPGSVKNSGMGSLVTGVPAGSAADTPKTMALIELISAAFRRAEVPFKMSDNIEGEVWMKMILNCTINPTCALTRAQYGQMYDDENVRETMRLCTRETIAIAKALGVKLPVADPEADVMARLELIREGTSSTSQDIERGRPTEIEWLNGYIARMGPKLGIPTPVNHTLYSMVNLLQKRPR
jgi:2-dehydropantoate 2-reductase